LDEDSLIHMNLIQPILRVDLAERLGTFSEEKRDEDAFNYNRYTWNSHLILPRGLTGSFIFTLLWKILTSSPDNAIILVTN